VVGKLRGMPSGFQGVLSGFSGFPVGCVEQHPKCSGLIEGCDTLPFGYHGKPYGCSKLVGSGGILRVFVGSHFVGMLVDCDEFLPCCGGTLPGCDGLPLGCDGLAEGHGFLMIGCGGLNVGCCEIFAFFWVEIKRMFVHLANLR
jgi:hypothetical protein